MLPARAAREGWALRRNHCFGRVLLDDAVGGSWYDVLDRRHAAYRQLDDERLAHAIAQGERLLHEGDPLLRELDAQSLRWRGKPPKAAPRTRASAARPAPQEPAVTEGPADGQLAAFPAEPAAQTRGSLTAARSRTAGC